ncbi:MAG: hypothetical protein L0211_23590 [Planctomycetaceae bacterium]|nr:hypothetical protein [Planctomycetaceae bacterium]
MPHELTHVVVSDMLKGRTAPRWLDEGIAMLADSPEKQALHAKDLAAARSAGLSFRASELLSLEAYPAPSRIPAFYGQSAALTSFLARRGKPSQLLEFAELTIERGPDQALRAVYDIDGIPALEREWLSQTTQQDSYLLARARP